MDSPRLSLQDRSLGLFLPSSVGVLCEVEGQQHYQEGEQERKAGCWVMFGAGETRLTILNFFQGELYFLFFGKTTSIWV